MLRRIDRLSGVRGQSLADLVPRFVEEKTGSQDHLNQKHESDTELVLRKLTSRISSCKICSAIFYVHISSTEQ